MTDFAHRLRHLASRLPIPEPTRSRVLLEMATDMEDLLQHYLDRGMSRADAVSAVEEHFELSDEALRELAEVHSSPLQRSLVGLSAQARSLWERVILALVASVVALGLATHLLRPALYRDASPLAYGLLLVLGVALALGVWKAVSLFGGRSRAVGPIPRPGIRSLLGLGLLLLGMGFAGIWLELYRSALLIRESPDMAFPHLAHWVHAASATLVVALSGALLIGLLWFILEARAAHLEERAAAGILEPVE